MPTLLIPPLLRDAPVSVASLDLRGHIVDANPALLGASGYSLDEMRDRSFAEFLDGSAADARASFFALASGAIDKYRAERRYRARSGAIFDVDLSVSLVRDDSGQPAGCLAVLQDVTAHKVALREAARRAAELEAVIQSIPASVIIRDEAGVRLANQKTLEQLGFGSLEEMGPEVVAIAAKIHARDAVTGEPLPPERLAFNRALRGERVDHEVRLTHLRTGQERIHRVIAAPIVQDGRTVGAVAVNVDITDTKAIEEALRLSEVRYRELVEQSPLSIQILAPDGRTLQVNRAWERLWGVTFRQISDYNILEDPQLLERGLMPHLQKAFDGEVVRVPAVVYDPKDTRPDANFPENSKRWVRGTLYPVKGPSGEVREIVLIYEDITDQVKADEQRRRAEQELERLLVEARRAHGEAEAAGRVKDEFLATLSHELRTPLNAVLGWARILRSRPIGDQAAHAVTVIERNATAQARLIDDLLDVSRIITGKIRLNVDLVDVESIARSALESVRPAADARRIRIDLHVADQMPAVAGDAQRLQQVFWNLLSNAVKFTEADGHVAISIVAEDHQVCVDVTDSGIGIAPDVLPFVFDRFMQADSSSTRAHSGLGLGLAIVRHLVELHGGTVKAESAGRGLGTTFRFWLPLPR